MTYHPEAAHRSGVSTYYTRLGYDASRESAEWESRGIWVDWPHLHRSRGIVTLEGCPLWYGWPTPDRQRTLCYLKLARDVIRFNERMLELERKRARR